MMLLRSQEQITFEWDGETLSLLQNDTHNQTQDQIDINGLGAVRDFIHNLQLVALEIEKHQHLEADKIARGDT